MPTCARPHALALRAHTARAPLNAAPPGARARSAAAAAQPQQAGLSSVPNVGPMLAGGMPFGGMPSAANAASNRLGAQQFAGMGAGFAMNRTGLNANMGGMRASAGACGSNGFSGMGAVMRGNAPGQGAMQMGSPYMCMNGMMGTSAGLQAHGGYAQSSDLLAMINKGNMPGMGPGGLGELGGADLAVGPQFDMSDFPALANRVAMSLQQQPMQPAGMHRAAVAAMQPPEPEFAIQSEDFPALPGVAPTGRDVFAQQGGLGVGSRAHVPSDGGGGHGQHGGLIHGLLDLRHAHHMQPSHVEPGQLLAQQQQQTHKRTPPGVASGGGSGGGDSGSGSGGSMEPYGLLGLLHVIRVTDADLNYLALGTDLTTLGLNLNSPDPLYGACARYARAARAARAAPLSERGAGDCDDPTVHPPACHNAIACRSGGGVRRGSRPRRARAALAHRAQAPLRRRGRMVRCGASRSTACHNAITCSRPRSRRRTLESSNSRRSFTSFTTCRGTRCRHTRPRSCTTASGVTTRTSSSGSRAPARSRALTMGARAAVRAERRRRRPGPPRPRPRRGVTPLSTSAARARAG